MNPEEVETGANPQPEIPAPDTMAEAVVSGTPSDEPLPVCDYTGENDAPCEEPATVRRWSSAAVVTGAALGGGRGWPVRRSGADVGAGMIPGISPLRAVDSGARSTPATVTISPSGQALDVPEAVAGKVVPSVVNITIQQAYSPTRPRDRRPPLTWATVRA